MKNWYKNQNGSMAVYVIATILCFIFILTGVFYSTTATRRAQLKSVMEITKAYEKNTKNLEEIYINRQILDTSKYVQNGLIIFYDGINNTGAGHSNTTTTWKDLSNKGIDGSLVNFDSNSWGNNCLSFDGINDWVKINEINSSAITIEIIVEYDKTPENTDIQSGKRYILTGSYAGSTMNLWENGVKVQTALSGTILNSINNTLMAISGKTNGDNVNGNLFAGRIYAVRIYDRVLNESEVLQNYQLDMKRYGA